MQNNLRITCMEYILYIKIYELIDNDLRELVTGPISPRVSRGESFWLRNMLHKTGRADNSLDKLGDIERRVLILRQYTERF